MFEMILALNLTLVNKDSRIMVILDKRINMKKRSKVNTQMPIHPESLTHVSFFVGYCQNNGLRIKKEDLEELHKYGLVFPALKIYVGVVEYKKIYANFDGKTEWRYINPEDSKKFKIIKSDKKKYYATGGLMISGAKWLNYYTDNKMTEHPS